jgi:hypothetical protein
MQYRKENTLRQGNEERQNKVVVCGAKSRQGNIGVLGYVRVKGSKVVQLHRLHLLYRLYERNTMYS